MLELHGLSKTYRSFWRGRQVRALHDFTLTVRRGEVVGIAGPNGAGKSTLLSLLLGFLHPTHGSVRIGGLSPRAYVERSGVGYLAELVAIPPKWTVEGTVQRCAVLANVPMAERAAQVERVLELLGLAEQRRKTARQLSKGNLQRLALAQALVGRHELVILDEPTHGLDPVWTQRFRDVVREERRPDRAFFIASHNLDELERLADRVIILHQGELQRVVGPGAETVLAEVHRATYRLRLATPYLGLTALAPGATPVPGREDEWRIHGDIAELNRVLGVLVAAGVIVLAFGPEESRLESEFRRAMGGVR
ncbi:MAG TPA: ABC transporter ATP-binding protein [Rugosimonospora sp.]|nr:ABC transporter ATP-binding protein [Rugosimonospora sp.]